MFINRWTTPLHVFIGSATDDDVEPLDEGGPAAYRYVNGDRDPPVAVCGCALPSANDTGNPAADDGDAYQVLHLPEMARWDDLAEFVHERNLCERCRTLLPVAWPPAADHMTTDAAGYADLPGVEWATAENMARELPTLAALAKDDDLAHDRLTDLGMTEQGARDLVALLAEVER